MLLQRCLRSVNRTRCVFSRPLSSDNTNDSSPDRLHIPPQDEASNFIRKSDVLEPASDTDESCEQKKISEKKSHSEMLNNLDSLHSLVSIHRKALAEESLRERPITREDFFNVKSLFTLRELFDSRVHLGHHMGCWHSANKKYLYGIRNNMHIIDIASTEQHLWRALNVVSLLAYSGGSVMFVNNRPGFDQIIQTAASCCGQRYWTKKEQLGKFDELDLGWFDENKPDLVICSSVNNPASQKLLLHCNKYLVPSVGILDSDVDPTNLTYVIPGNDDSSQSILFYHKVFAKAIQRAKAAREALRNLEASASAKGAV